MSKEEYKALLTFKMSVCLSTTFLGLLAIGDAQYGQSLFWFILAGLTVLTIIIQTHGN